MIKRLDRVGCSDGILKGGEERGWKRAPRGRSCMLSRSRYSGDGHAWNSMSDIRVDMQLGSLWGGGSYFWKGVHKKGGSDEPPLVTGLDHRTLFRTQRATRDATCASIQQ